MAPFHVQALAFLAFPPQVLILAAFFLRLFLYAPYDLLI